MSSLTFVLAEFNNWACEHWYVSGAVVDILNAQFHLLIPLDFDVDTYALSFYRGDNQELSANIAKVAQMASLSAGPTSHKPGGLNNRQNLEVKVRAAFLACRKPTWCCVLTWQRKCQFSGFSEGR